MGEAAREELVIGYWWLVIGESEGGAVGVERRRWSQVRRVRGESVGCSARVIRDLCDNELRRCRHAVSGRMVSGLSVGGAGGDEKVTVHGPKGVRRGDGRGYFAVNWDIFGLRRAKNRLSGDFALFFAKFHEFSTPSDCVESQALFGKC